MSTVATFEPPALPANTDFYPASDGEPLAETGIHVEAIINLIVLLKERYRGRQDIFLGCDQYWYWEEGNPNARRSPDILYAEGVVPREEIRRSFFTWLENDVIPQFIIEFPSEKTWKNDLTDKYELYERLGVQEYFVFDPEAIHVKPPLKGWRLRNGTYQRIPEESDGSLLSKTLGLRLSPAGILIRVADAASGLPLLNGFEKARMIERQAKEDAKRAEESERIARAEARRLTEQARKAQDEFKQAQTKIEESDAEIARLKEENARLKNPQGPASS